jgi:hypothetical protein
MINIERECRFDIDYNAIVEIDIRRRLTILIIMYRLIIDDNFREIQYRDERKNNRHNVCIDGGVSIYKDTIR